MAASAEGEPASPPPGGWLSGLVSGAGRILAAVLGPDFFSDDDASSSPESSQSPPPPLRARSTADQFTGEHYDSYQLNKSGMEIVLKDDGKQSLEMVSDMDPKDAAAQLLKQETFSRSECDALIKIIQERVVDSDPSVDEPDVVLPIAWLPSTQQHPVAYSSLSPNNSPPQTSGFPSDSPVFDNIGEKTGLKKRSTAVGDPCIPRDLSHDQHRHALRRSYSYTADAFGDRRVRPKLNRSNISEKLIDVPSSYALFDDPVIHDAGDLRGFHGEFKDVPLLGTDNLTFSNMVLKGDDGTARPDWHLTASSLQAEVKKRSSANFYPYSNLDLTQTFPVKVEPFSEFAPLEPEMMDLAQKNDERTMSNDSCSVSKMIFQEDIEAAPSSSMALQGEKRSINCKKGLELQGNIPTKGRSPAHSRCRPSSRRAIRSWNRPPQHSNPASVGQEPRTCHSQGKRPAGRSRNTEKR